MELKVMNPQKVDVNTVGLLQLAFETVQRKLDLLRIHSTVEVTFWEGIGRAAAITDIRARDPYHIHLSASNPMTLVANLAHEMVHVADLAKGHLQVVDKSRLSYKGKTINGDIQHLAAETDIENVAMPYEVEAYTQMWPLTAAVWHDLPPSARDYLDEGKPGRTLDRCQDRAAEYQEQLVTFRKAYEDFKKTIGSRMDFLE